MSQLSLSELEKVRKAAIQSVTISSEMKTSVVDVKLRELSAEIKKLLLRNGMVEVVVISGRI
jgi:hypothetical protein